MKSRTRIAVLILMIVALNIGCDQFTKEYARKNIKDRGIINLAGDFFVLVYVENDGAFLSMGSNIRQPYKTILLMVFPLLVVIGSLIYLLLDKKLSIPKIICFSSIIGGGISNIFERAVNNGFVTDFINFGIGNIRTGILNCADMSITFGVIFLLLFEYIESRKAKKAVSDV